MGERKKAADYRASRAAPEFVRVNEAGRASS
jgi:hypothetical protein